ncbi:MAG: hypothetical protein IKZ45_01845 [Fibrobacter sp.]|nr:hypothetical protein [Fibrobacter sp.]
MTRLPRILCLMAGVLVTALFAAPPVSTPGSYIIDFSKYDFIDSTLNIIQFPGGRDSFEPFFQKMDSLVFENKGKVNILHIGGSHIQADVVSGRIREHLIKEYPGSSAGRGFVFPYSAARTNTPSSYGSKYKGVWDMSKNVLREVKKPLGLLGIAVSTSDPRAEFSLLLDKYNPAPIYEETRFRLFGYSDSNNVVPVLVVDSVDIKGVYDSLTQSYVFKSPRPIDTLTFAFRWADTTLQAKVTQYLVDSLVQDSIYRANLDTLNADSTADSTAKKNALPPAQEASADSMFQGDCDIMDTTCLEKEEPKVDLLAACRVYLESTQKADTVAAADSTKKQADSTVVADTLQKVICDSLIALSQTLSIVRPRFTMTGVISESDYPGIVYTNVGINGARIAHYFEEVCPLFEKELAFLKPDLVIFAIGINDANVEKFDDKTFRNNYDILIERIRRVNPNVAFIFETNNDMYRKVRKRRYVQHPVGEQARKAFFQLAEKHKAGVWDKFSLMGGLGSMAKWEKASLAKKDKIHFNMAGYHLLGDMFYKALIDAYQEHIANQPALEPSAKKPEDKPKK